MSRHELSLIEAEGVRCVAGVVGKKICLSIFGVDTGAPSRLVLNLKQLKEFNHQVARLCQTLHDEQSICGHLDSLSPAIMDDLAPSPILVLHPAVDAMISEGCPQGTPLGWH